MNGAYTPGLMKKMQGALPKRYCNNPAKQMGAATHAVGHNRTDNVLMKTSYPDSYLMQTGNATKADSSFVKENHPTFAGDPLIRSWKEMEEREKLFPDLPKPTREMNSDHMQANKLLSIEAVNLANKKNIDVDNWKKQISNNKSAQMPANFGGGMIEQ